MSWEFDFLYVLQELHNPILDVIMLVLTTIGNGGVIWILAAVILLLSKKYRACGILLGISMILGVLIGNLALKNMILRDRPCWIDTTVSLLISNPHDYSFPSGHSLNSFVSATMIFLFDKRLGALAFVLALGIAFSRLYLFVHFPTDVIGGAMLGIAISLTVFGIYKCICKKKRVKQDACM